MIIGWSEQTKIKGIAGEPGIVGVVGLPGPQGDQGPDGKKKSDKRRIHPSTYLLSQIITNLNESWHNNPFF